MFWLDGIIATQWPLIAEEGNPISGVCGSDYAYDESNKVYVINEKS